MIYRPFLEHETVDQALQNEVEFQDKQQLVDHLIRSLSNPSKGAPFTDKDVLILPTEKQDLDIGWKNVFIVCVSRCYDWDYVRETGEPCQIGYCSTDYVPAREVRERREGEKQIPTDVFKGLEEMIEECERQHESAGQGSRRIIEEWVRESCIR